MYIKRRKIYNTKKIKNIKIKEKNIKKLNTIKNIQS